jgi:2-oxo-hept-3-ene-1,7-dioate hydratase
MNIQEAALALQEAETSKNQIRPFSVMHPNITIEEAYKIQTAWMDLKYAAGRKRIGRKVGLTSKAMQQALNIKEPDHGVLLDDMLFDDGGIIPCARFIQTRVEAELAFVLKTPLSGKNVNIFDVLNATDYVVPALEILDTRIHRLDPVTKQPRKVMDTIADNAANAGIVVGGRPFKPNEYDLRWVGALVHKNAALEETGLAAGVLNHPANGIVWLARKLAEHNIALEAGEIFLSGSFIRPIEAWKGDTIHADFGAFGSVTCHFN